MSELTMRPARPEDEAAVVAIALSEWEAIYQGYRDQLGDEIFDTFFPDYREGKAASIRQNLASGTMHVTECEGRVVGFIHYVYDEHARVATISHNAVSGEFRGRGIGPKQYEMLFARLTELGAIGVRVTTGLDDAHAPARRAYGKAGFVANTQAITYYKKL